MDDDTARAARAKKGSPFLNTDQAAFYIGLSSRTLEKMRSFGRGPKFRRHGRHVRYHIADLDNWSDARSGDTTGTARGRGGVDG
ncbi:AlpA family transcriptional regulator [Inquilinus sp. Marseille-Q2685]|uniref:helix-turn-helix transcriptional regulator n=1 Tax=Inquilinus sp. Marseille-Q2685 TaxID=2866581 RepID=UPI001CE43AA2|nr:helix-turn-helix domain-containing protein [Inquilinus sp. Marseille-Q2685]